MANLETWSRREVVRIGGLSLAGTLAPRVARSVIAEESPRLKKRCIFLMLQGGPSHLDLWDPKPNAGREVRGPFQTTSTRLPGVAFGELIPGQASIADQLTIIRSMTHQFTNHIAGTYITLTGSTNQQDRDREAHPDDFPGPGAILNHLRPSQNSIPSSISLPNWLSIPGPSNRMPGQYGGFLGPVCNPFLVEGDPNQNDFNPLSLQLTSDMNLPRLNDRRSLLQQLDHAARWLAPDKVEESSRLNHSAYELVTDGRIRDALSLSEVSDSDRERYGRNKLGQSLLLAKRLSQAGVPWVGYNEFNQKWDTHGGLKGRYEQIVPPLDQAFTALIRDLKQEGLLDETIVVLAGEFGRTPKVNDGAGRDHWPNAYSIVMAGGGLQSGLVFGTTDNQGAEVLSDAVSPADVLATVWHLMGLDPQTTMYDRLERPHLVSSGRIRKELLS
jgi:hypothetical protein